MPGRLGGDGLNVEQLEYFCTVAAGYEGDDDVQSDPIILSAETRLEPGSSSGVNTAALKNPHGLPMELLWVRFSLFPLTPDVPDVELLSSMTGMVVGVKMDLGKIPVVDAGVPISCFGAARDDWDVINRFYLSPTTIVLHNTYTWRLKHPLYIPAGATLVPLFQHYGQIPYPAQVRVTYMCRSLSAKKRTGKTWVPWVTSWRSRGFDFASADTVLTAQYDESSEIDIVNPFDVPVNVVRFCGRQSLTTPLNNLQNSESSILFPASAFISEAGDSNTTLTMKSSSGDEIVRNETQFGGLFPLNLKVWDIPGGWSMAPGEFLKIRAAFAPQLNAEDPGRVQVGVSAVGYRKVDVEGFV